MEFEEVKIFFILGRNGFFLFREFDICSLGVLFFVFSVFIFFGSVSGIKVKWRFSFRSFVVRFWRALWGYC